MTESYLLEAKLNFLNKLEQKSSLTNTEFIKLKKMSIDFNNEVRNRTAQILGRFPGEYAEEILINMLDDKDELVKTNVCDSLCFSKSKDVFEKLKRMSRNQSYLVRGYAVLSVGDIAQNTNEINQTKKFLMNGLKSEKSIWVKLNYYLTLYELGEQKYYYLILKQFDNRYASIRLYAIRLIIGLYNSNYKMETTVRIKERLNIEKNKVVRESLSNLLNRIINL